MALQHGRWETFPTYQMYFPYVVRKKSDGQIFYIQAVVGEGDIDDDQPAWFNPEVLVRDTISRREKWILF